MPVRYLIGSVTVGSGGAASMSFTSIPSTYTNLCLVLSARGDNAALYNVPDIRPNNQQPTNTGATNMRYLQGDGASASSGTDGLIKTTIPGANNTSNTFSNNQIYIPNYTSSNYKSLSIESVDENNATTGYATMTAALWDRTTAISSLYIYPSASANFVQYSTAYLYGIKNS